MLNAILIVLALLGYRPADPPVAAPRSIRVAVIGDGNSLSNDRERPFDSWPEQLGRMLGERSEVVNCSRGGNRLTPEARQFILSMPELRKAEDTRAEVVVLALGGSDLGVADGDPPKIREGLLQVLEAMNEFKPEPRIVLCIPPPTISGPRAERYRQGLDAIAPMLTEVARERGLTLVDLRPSMQGLEPASPGMLSPPLEASGRMASIVFRAITGDQPPSGAGPYRDSFDASSYVRTPLVTDGVAARTIPAGWSNGTGDSAGMLVGETGAEPLLMEGAIPEGPFRMQWRFRWSAGPEMDTRGGPQAGAGGNWLSLDNRNASMQITGPDVRGRPELPATARVAPRGTMLEIELRRSQGVLEWRVDGKPVYATAIGSKSLANAGLHPMGARVELASWTLDLPKD